jgi:hypothetical protein
MINFTAFNYNGEIYEAKKLEETKKVKGTPSTLWQFNILGTHKTGADMFFEYGKFYVPDVIKTNKMVVAWFEEIVDEGDRLEAEENAA